MPLVRAKFFPAGQTYRQIKAKQYKYQLIFISKNMEHHYCHCATVIINKSIFGIIARNFDESI